MAREFTTVSRDIREYVPKDWLDENGQPEANAWLVKFKPLSKRQLAQFADNSSRLSIQSNTILLGNATNSLEVFRMAVVGWDNFIVDKVARPFKKDISGLVEEDVLEIIPLDIIEEVATHIVRVSKFTEEEMGK